ncbi:MAG: lipoyl(octanoyl) transferase [Cuniculiplasma sp. C_DKE]|nr:MAG: lipoyl(octanoyl) transferase [Cuniculiplasma sp. C_DKE]
MLNPGLKNREINGQIEFSIFQNLPYSEGLALQRRINMEMIEGSGMESIIICEHDPVYTCGIHHEGNTTDLENVHFIERGGGITYHGPGQITAYFLINLNQRGINILDLINYVHGVEIQYLEQHGIIAHSRLKKETGVWVDNHKISSTGFAIRGGFTLHGIGLNVNTDLEKFSLINPCGYDWSVMTSVSKINDKIYRMEEEKKLFMKILKENLEIS